MRHPKVQARPIFITFFAGLLRACTVLDLSTLADGSAERAEVICSPWQHLLMLEPLAIENFPAPALLNMTLLFCLIIQLNYILCCPLESLLPRYCIEIENANPLADQPRFEQFHGCLQTSVSEPSSVCFC